MTESSIRETQSSELDNRFQRTAYAVAATTMERIVLNSQYKNRLHWNDDENGLVLTLAIFDDMPITYNFWWTEVNGKLVVFYECAGDVDFKKYIARFFEGLQIPVTKAIDFMRVIMSVTEGKGLSN